MGGWVISLRPCICQIRNAPYKQSERHQNNLTTGGYGCLPDHVAVALVRSAVKLRVLVAFSGGLNRGVQLTGPSLFANVLSPMRRAGWAVTVFCSGLAPAALLDGVRSYGALM